MHRMNGMTRMERDIARVEIGLVIATDEAATVTLATKLPNGRDKVQTLFYSGAKAVQPGKTFLDYAPMPDTTNGKTVLGETPTEFVEEYKALQDKWKAKREADAAN